MTFNTRLIDLLKTDPRFVDDNGELLLAAVQDMAWKLDRGLVRLLLSDAEVKARFFEEIEGHWIFDLNTFIDYTAQKNFLDNSYTRFRNRIGLAIGGKYLRERGEVALVWPYKDCVLEGGQTGEEEKRKEIFFNEVLAQDEINRLLDPKVLTGFKRYTVQGEEPVTDFRRDEDGVIRENIILKGNNLVALHTLKHQFRGKVKLIYIDPPYNTGNDEFQYNDNFNHSTWLTFMKNRLEAARELLCKEGSIWINIDDDEAHYLKVLCDEVFGRENFVANVVWEKSDSPRMDAEYFSVRHDHILIFGKNKESLFFNKITFNGGEIPAHYNKIDEEGRKYYLKPLRGMGGQGSTRTARPNLYYALIAPDGTEVYPKLQDGSDGAWRWSKTKYQKEQNRIEWVYSQKGWSPYYRIYSDRNLSRPPETIWRHSEVGSNRTSKAEINSLFPASESFGTPKPEKLLQRIIEIATRTNEIVVDFYCGSGTTAAVAHKMGRHYIGVEQMDYIEAIPVERLKKVIGKEIHKEGQIFSELNFDQGGISRAVNWQGGGDFIYCELMKYNQAYLERIREAASGAELAAIWREMARGSFLNWYVNPAVPEDALKDFQALGQTENGLEKQKHLLAELLDKNQLYVNLSEIDDAQFQVSQEDKTLNRMFYADTPSPPDLRSPSPNPKDLGRVGEG